MVGIVVGVLHLVGYVPPRYRRMLSDVQHSTAEAITQALEAQFSKMMEEGEEALPDPAVALEPLTARLDALPAAFGVELKKAFVEAQNDFAKEMSKPFEGVPPEITGAIGGLAKASNQKTGDLRNAIGQGLLGPYGSLLQQFMPPLYDYLTENPDMVVQALEMPVVQKLIQRAASMAGNVTQAAESGWGR